MLLFSFGFSTILCGLLFAVSVRINRMSQNLYDECRQILRTTAWPSPWPLTYLLIKIAYIVIITCAPLKGCGTGIFASDSVIYFDIARAKSTYIVITMSVCLLVRKIIIINIFVKRHRQSYRDNSQTRWGMSSKLGHKGGRPPGVSKFWCWSNSWCVFRIAFNFP